MIEILPQTENEMLAVKISGELSDDDYEKLRPELDLRADGEESFDLLVELADIEGLDAAAVRKDVEFARDFADDIGKMAVITEDTKWSLLSDFVGTPIGELMGIDVERFDNRNVALEWLRSN